MKNEGVIPLFNREQWPRWQKLFKDMSSTYDVWLMNHVQLLKNLKSIGFPVNAVEIDFDAYIAWVGLEGLPADSETRSRFAMHVFQQRSGKR